MSKASSVYLQSLTDANRWRFFAAILAVSNIALILLVILLFPLKEKQVEYIAIAEKQDLFFRVLPAPLPQNMKLLLLRRMLREYVHNRVTFDDFTESSRFGKVMAMSSKAVFEQFHAEYDRLVEEGNFSRRKVTILRDHIIDEGDNIHQIEFETTDFHNGDEYKNQWVVTLQYELQSQIVNAANELSNPLGLAVIRYEQSQKLTNEKKLNEIFKN